MQYIRYIVCCLCIVWPMLAQAQTKHSFTIRNGQLVGQGTPAPSAGQQPATNAPVNNKQQWMLAGLSSMMQGDYATAEQYYSRVISQYGGDSEAYLQRAICRRELGKKRYMMADAKAALTLLNRKIQYAPQNADLYHRRSMALRLLQAFDQARQDVIMASRLKGKANLTYKNDLQAIELERRIAQTGQ